METDHVISSLARDQHGIVARRHLLSVGVTRRQIETRVGQRILRPLHDGVYLHGAWPLTRAGRLLAAQLACGDDAVLSHRTSARLAGMERVPVALPELSVPIADRRRRPGLIVHRATALDPCDIIVRNGLRVTTPARALFELGRVLPAHVVAPIAEDAVIRGITSAVELVCLLERLGGRGVPGTATLRHIIASALPSAKLESRLELHLHQLILSCDVPPPVLQLEIRLLDGRVVRIDFAWPDIRLAVEADGRRWHSNSRDFARDLARANAIEASGWGHLRYGWFAVHEQADLVRHQIERAYRRAAAAA